MIVVWSGDVGSGGVVGTSPTWPTLTTCLSPSTSTVGTSSSLPSPTAGGPTTSGSSPSSGDLRYTSLARSHSGERLTTWHLD